jgi:hypothetical protein
MLQSGVQPLDHGIIYYFKIQYKNFFLGWVLLQFYPSTNHQNLRKTIPNARHDIMWCMILCSAPECGEKLISSIIRNKWMTSMVLPANWGVDFARMMNVRNQI